MNLLNMKPFSLLKSANRSENRRNRQAVRAKRPNILEQSDFFEGLEKRQLLTATYSASGSQFIIDLNSAGDLQVSSNGTSYLFTLTNGSGGINTWSGTGTASVSGANLTANAASLAAYDTFTIRRSANFPRVRFVNSIGNYTDNFNHVAVGVSQRTHYRCPRWNWDGDVPTSRDGGIA